MTPLASMVQNSLKIQDLTRQGFTLLELMIVVAVLAIVMAVAIPSLRNARMAANESSTLQTIKTIVSVNEQYRFRFSSFADTLGNLEAAGYIDGGFQADNEKSGYTYTYAGNASGYTITTDPTVPGSSGVRYFYCDQSGAIRFDASGVADATSPPIE